MPRLRTPGLAASVTFVLSIGAIGCGRARAGRVPGLPPASTLTPIRLIRSAGNPSGGTTGPLLTRIFDAWTGPGGRLYVTQEYTPGVLIFGPAGRYLGTSGHTGAGPGEFPSGFGEAIGFLGDTLWVEAVMAGRINGRLPDGRWHTLASFSLPQFSAPGLGQIWPRCLFRDGSALGAPATITMPIGSQADTARGRAPLLRVSAHGQVLDTLGWLRPWRRMVLVRVGQSYVTPASWFRDGTLARCSADGRRALVLETSDPSAAAGFRVTALSLDGDTVWSRHYDVPGAVLGAARRTALLDSAAKVIAAVAGMPTAAAAAGRALVKLLPLPRRMPAAAELVPGEDGTIWVEHARADPDSVDWLVLDGHGRMIRRVVMASRFRLLDVTAGAVWATTAAAYDVPMLVEFRVH